MMIPPEIRRSVLLQKAIKLALAGTLPKDCKIMGRMTWQWKSPGAF
ncbi:hypothetical protein VWV41_001795 [Salmonella enterica subsp. enterica serovar Kentucky]|nr:hypothetical protein [Salmonella enterica subsp. enterica serovar Kentucky]